MDTSSPVYIAVSFAISVLTTCLVPGVAAIGAAVRSRRSQDRLATWRRWWFVGAMGVGAGLVAISFLVAPVAMARTIGFGTADDFQREIAFANLGFALAAVLSLRADARGRLAVAAGYAVFLWGAIIGHVYEAVAHGNRGSGNVGGILLYDLAVPLVALLLVRAELRTASASTPTSGLRTGAAVPGSRS
jgi:hypothetical protein